METVIVAIVVGAFSGLLGSIAGPFLRHHLDRSRREELRQEEKNRELRRMLEVTIRLGNISHYTTLEIQLTEMQGGNVNQVMETSAREIYELRARHPEVDWQPERIRDETLRRLANDLLSAQTQLHWLIGVRRGTWPPLGTLRNWPEQTRNVRHWVSVLAGATVQRMDDLGW